MVKKEKMEQDLRDKIERWKIKAESFLDNNIKAFIVDINDQYYFCNIIFVSDDSIHVKSFTGKLKGETSRIFWSDVVKFKEYEEREVKND